MQDDHQKLQLTQQVSIKIGYSLKLQQGKKKLKQELMQQVMLLKISHNNKKRQNSLEHKKINLRTTMVILYQRNIRLQKLNKYS